MIVQKIHDMDLFVGRYTPQYLDMLQDVSQRGRNTFNHLCKEFGVVDVKMPEFFLMHCHGFGGVTVSSSNTEDNYQIVAINVAHYCLFYNMVVSEIIPHEVVHAFSNIIYPEKRVEYHSREWSEVMEFLGLEPKLYLDLTDLQLKELDKFQVNRLV